MAIFGADVVTAVLKHMNKDHLDARAATTPASTVVSAVGASREHANTLRGFNPRNRRRVRHESLHVLVNDDVGWPQWPGEV